MSPSKSKKKKKRKKKSDFKSFIYIDEEGPVWCPLCVKQLGDAALPLSHFPILVPERPIGKRVTHPDPKKDSGMLVHWRTEYLRLCRSHAIYVLQTMTNKDLVPTKKHIEE